MPRIIGVLNLTEDSFSDGGQYLDPATAIAKAHALIDDGAYAVDLGAVASNPDARTVAIATEIARLDPLIEALHARSARVSVDSFRPETQIHAINRQVAFLNDIHGFPDPSIYPAIAASPCRLIVMHSLHGPTPITRAETPADDIVATILGFFATRIAALQAGGIHRSRLILDPGMGYFLGANPRHSFAALAGLRRLREAFNLPILVGVSRKSFLRAATGNPDPTKAGPATLAAELYAAMQGVDYIRTHDVGALHGALAVLAAIKAEEAAKASCR